MELKRVPFLIIALAVALVPFVTSRHLFYGAVNAKYFFVLAAVSALALYVSSVLVRRGHVLTFRSRPLLIATLALLAVHYLSMFAGVYPLGSFYSDIIRSTGVLFLTYVAFLSLATGELFAKRDWMLLWRAVAAAGGIFALLSFFGPEGLDLSGRLLSVNLTISGLTIANSTFAGAFLVLSFLITLLALAQSAPGTRARLLLGFSALAQLFSPILIGERLWAGEASLASVFSQPTVLLGAARASGAALLLVILYLLGWLAIDRFARERLKRIAVRAWAGLFIVGLVGVVALLFVPGSAVREAYTTESTAARLIVWEGGLTAFRDRPLLGWGPENFRIAHDRYLDNQLYLDENIGEVWFDRAHNLVVDTLVSVGSVGALAFLAVLLFFLRTIVRAQKRGLLAPLEAQLLGILPFAHALQLQTSFDTVTTYVLVGLVAGYGLFLERELARADRVSGPPDAKPSVASKVFGGALALAALAGFWFGAVKEYARQDALFELFATEETVAQTERIGRTLEGPPRFEMIRLPSSSLVKGTLEQLPRVAEAERAALLSATRTELDLYASAYERYLLRVREDYRARMNYVHLLLLKTTFGENRLADAKAIIEDSYRLSPENPLTYALHALAELYGGNVAGAREKAQEMLALNPDIEFSQEVASYIEEQAKQFPTITILKLENL